MKQVLKERGWQTECWWNAWDSLKSRQLRTWETQYLESKGHTALLLPKFHPEINPIERVWAMSKQYTKAYCKYTLPSLRKTIPLALNSLKVENIQNFHRKCWHYLYAYLEEHVAGGALEAQVKKYKPKEKKRIWRQKEGQLVWNHFTVMVWQDGEDKTAIYQEALRTTPSRSTTNHTKPHH